MSNDQSRPEAALPPGSELAPRRLQDVIPFRDAVRAWFGISLQTFGGPCLGSTRSARSLPSSRFSPR